MSGHGAPDPFIEQDRDSDSGLDLYLDGSDEDHSPTGATGRSSRGGRGKRPEGAKPRRSPWKRALIAVLISGLVLGLGAVGLFWFFSERYLGNIERIADPFQGIKESDRPAPVNSSAGEDSVTFLLVGSDSRDPESEGPPTARSDVIMLMRITGDRKNVQFISIPRDSWVPIPGRGLNKINAAYAFGGPSLLIQTVEAITATRIDHFAAVDFSGFKEITDALGGVDVQVAQTTSNGGVTFTAGLNHLNGEEALLYVRQRYNLPGGDLDRVQRQQNYLRAVLGTVFQQNLLSDLGTTDALLLALTSAISVDESLSTAAMVGLAYDMRGLTQGSLNFLTAPVSGLGREGEQSVVYLDTNRASVMWSYLKDDSLAGHIAEFEAEQLPRIPN